MTLVSLVPQQFQFNVSCFTVAEYFPLCLASLLICVRELFLDSTKILWLQNLRYAVYRLQNVSGKIKHFHTVLLSSLLKDGSSDTVITGRIYSSCKPDYLYSRGATVDVGQESESYRGFRCPFHANSTIRGREFLTRWAIISILQRAEHSFKKNWSQSSDSCTFDWWSGSTALKRARFVDRPPDVSTGWLLVVPGMQSRVTLPLTLLSDVVGRGVSRDTGRFPGLIRGEAVQGNGHRNQ